jgi:hypothetical protein
MLYASEKYCFELAQIAMWILNKCLYLISRIELANARLPASDHPSSAACAYTCISQFN